MPGYEKDMPGYEKDMPGYEKDMPGYENDMPGYEKDMPGYEKDIPGTDPPAYKNLLCNKLISSNLNISQAPQQQSVSTRIETLFQMHPLHLDQPKTYAACSSTPSAAKRPNSNPMFPRMRWFFSVESITRMVESATALQGTTRVVRRRSIMMIAVCGTCDFGWFNALRFSFMR